MSNHGTLPLFKAKKYNFFQNLAKLSLHFKQLVSFQPIPLSVCMEGTIYEPLQDLTRYNAMQICRPRK